MEEYIVVQTPALVDPEVIIEDDEVDQPFGWCYSVALFDEVKANFDGVEEIPDELEPVSFAEGVAIAIALAMKDNAAGLASFPGKEVLDFLRMEMAFADESFDSLR